MVWGLSTYILVSTIDCCKGFGFRDLRYVGIIHLLFFIRGPLDLVGVVR